MSGTRINKIVAKGFKTAGKILGFDFGLYRIVESNYLDPLTEKNFVGKYKMSWTEDESYVKNPEDVLGFFKMYMDYRKLVAGDILYSEDLNRTFVVTEVNPIRGAVAVQTPDRMNISRSISTPNSDVKNTLTQFISNMPCVVNYSGAKPVHGTMKTVHSDMVSGLSDGVVWTWVTPELLKLGDIVEIVGKEYMITSLSGKHKGTFMNIRSIKPGV